MSSVKEPTPKSERKKTDYQVAKRGTFMVLIDDVFYPTNDVNLELDASMSAIAVVLDDTQFTAETGIRPTEVKHFVCRRFYRDPRRSTVAYNHNEVRQMMNDLDARMYPEPGMPRWQKEAIWMGIKAFEERFTGKLDQ